MNAIEKVRKIREINRDASGCYEHQIVYDLSEPEAAALLTDEPSKTAEELGRKMSEEAYEGCDEYFTALIQSALTAHAKAAVEEAAERFCAMCPGNGIEECEWDNCSDRAAILGREVWKLS